MPQVTTLVMGKDAPLLVITYTDDEFKALMDDAEEKRPAS
jgi:hypothetical protein